MVTRPPVIAAATIGYTAADASGSMTMSVLVYPRLDLVCLPRAGPRQLQNLHHSDGDLEIALRSFEAVRVTVNCPSARGPVRSSALAN